MGTATHVVLGVGNVGLAGPVLIAVEERRQRVADRLWP